jgi:hypothetical protein
LVQPVPVPHYSDIVPEMRTGVEGVLLANSTQIINSNLNNNAMVKIANRAVELVIGRVTEQVVNDSLLPQAALLGSTGASGTGLEKQNA